MNRIKPKCFNFKVFTYKKEKKKYFASFSQILHGIDNFIYSRGEVHELRVLKISKIKQVSLLVTYEQAPANVKYFSMNFTRN